MALIQEIRFPSCGPVYLCLNELKYESKNEITPTMNLKREMRMEIFFGVRNGLI